MINFTTITPELLTLVGFRETSSIDLSTSLQTSDSGLFTNSLPDVTMDLIKDAATLDISENITSGDLTVGNWYEITNITGGTDFLNVGASANTVGVLFEATATTPTSWGTAGALNTQPVIDYLNIVRTDEIQNILKQFVTALQFKLKIQEIKVNDKLVKQFGTVELDQSEVARGYYFKLANSKTLKMVIKSLSLQLNAIDTCRVYLYEVGQTAAIFTHDYTSKVNQIDFETLTDWEATYEDETNVGKEYLLLYYEYDADNIQAAIQLESTTKAVYNADCFKSIHNNFVYFTPLNIPKSKWTWNAVSSEYDIPDFSDTKPLAYRVDTQNGLNIDYNIVCDITQLLIDNKAIFSKMLQLAYAIRILNDANTNPRSNRVARNADIKLVDYSNKYMMQLYGDNVNTNDGVRWISGEISRVVNNFKNIDCKCFNKNEKGFLISNSFQTNN